MSNAELKENYSDKYLHVDPDFHEIVLGNIDKSKYGKVHFFTAAEDVGLAEGELQGIMEESNSKYLIVDSTPVRLDKIITILGRPGPAYDLYDRFANVCLSCEDLGQFGA